MSDDRAALSAAATFQNNIAAADAYRLVVIGIGIDEKFTRRKEHNASAIGLCCGNCSFDGTLVRQGIIGDRTISRDIEYGMRDIGNGFAEVVIARIRKIG